MPAVRVSQPLEVKAGEAGALATPPTEIEVLATGTWQTPNHGVFTITRDMLKAAVEKHQQLFGSRGLKIPIDYDHDDITKGSAGWLTDLFIKPEDPDHLYASSEWTSIAAEQLKHRVFRYLSPEFWIKGYENPEVKGEYHDNVLSGLAVTNHQLFKGLKPLTASESSGGKNMFIYVKGEDRMNLEELRKKKPADLSEAEKTFLGENKDKLTADERKAFGVPSDAEKAEAEKAAADKAAAEKAAADAKAAEEAGKVEGNTQVKISASELQRLQADAKRGVEAADKLDRNEATAVIKGHVARGAIKSDHADEGVQLLLASAPAFRKTLEDFLAKLPDNQLLKAGEMGKDGESADEDPATAFDKLASDRAVKDKISYREATRLLASEQPELYRKATEPRIKSKEAE